MYRNDHLHHAPTGQGGVTKRTNTMLKGLGALGDMAGMMKKAQEMQGKMAQLQDGRRSGQGNRHRQRRAEGAGHRPLHLQRRRQGSGRRPDPRRHQGRAGQSLRPRAGRNGQTDRRHGPARRHEAPLLNRPKHHTTQQRGHPVPLHFSKLNLIPSAPRGAPA